MNIFTSDFTRHRLPKLWCNDMVNASARQRGTANSSNCKVGEKCVAVKKIPATDTKSIWSACIFHARPWINIERLQMHKPSPHLAWCMFYELHANRVVPCSCMWISIRDDCLKIDRRLEPNISRLMWMSRGVLGSCVMCGYALPNDSIPIRRYSIELMCVSGKIISHKVWFSVAGRGCAQPFIHNRTHSMWFTVCVIRDQLGPNDGHRTCTPKFGRTW